MTTVRLARRATVAASLLAVAVFVPLLLAGSDSEAQTPFTPTYEVTLVDPTAGANSDIKTNFLLPAPNYNFAGLVGFTPPQFGVAKGTDIPIGAVVARLTSTATLGLINDGCFTSAVIPFTFLNGSVNPADTIDPLPAGTEDRLKNIGGLLTESDANGNGIPDGADKYPSWLTRIFRTNESDPSSVITPRARLAADVYLLNIVGVKLSVILNIVVFEPGQTIDPPGPRPPITFDPSLGYPSVTVLQTLGDRTERPSPGAITDFCTRLIALTTVLGVTEDNPNTAANEGGIPYRTNPPAGSYNFVNYFVSQRDADLDGTETGMDPCPLNADPTWNPRLPIGQASYTGDSDKDGIPDSCDGVQSATGDNDTDRDGYDNRGDNCPKVQNGINPVSLVIIGPNNQDDDDLDGIGNECDQNPQTADGFQWLLCKPFKADVGAGGGSTPSEDQYLCNESNVCLDAAKNGACDFQEGIGPGTGTVDSDGDGVADGTDRCANTPAGATVDQFGCTAAQAVLDDDADGVLNASDACPGTAAGASVDAKGCSAAQLASGGGGTGGTGGTGGPDTGVGALAPAVSSIPTWAAIASGLGGAGLLSGVGSLVLRLFRRRRL